ncbi:MAG: carboxypeptidase-like regulatory domain-containing protein, partial [Bacteroidia bacterium]
MKRIFICILFLFFAFAASAQTIKGRIIDAKTNQGLPFVSLQIKNTQTGTLTDIDGKFTLDVPANSNAEIQITYLGYLPQTLAVSSF